MRSSMRSSLFAVAAALGAAMPASAQQSFLPPQAQQAYFEMFSIAQQLCNAGLQDACGEMSLLQAAYTDSEQVAMMCQQGDPNACQLFQSNMNEVSQAYQRYMVIAQQAAQQFQGGGGGFGQPMPHDQFQALMAQRHQQNMNTFEQNSIARSNNMKAFRDRIGLGN